ncbi:hypothetical protein AgCh_018624 [Apium graveolens]
MPVKSMGCGNRMEESKWENLNLDCLVNIFGRRDVESLLLSRLASAFGAGDSVNISRLIKFVVDRSPGCCSKIVLASVTTIADLVYVSDVSPNLKTLVLPTDHSMLSDHGATISELIAKWKSLEVLESGKCSSMEKIIEQIGLYCKNFVGLSVAGAEIDHKVSVAIVSKHAGIKSLVLERISINTALLTLILGKCNELELLHVRNCTFTRFGFFDEEVDHYVSGIKDFQYQGNVTMPYDVLDLEDLRCLSEEVNAQESSEKS